MKYIQIKADEKQQIKRLSELASGIVKEHYDPIIGPEQNDYMIKKFQSVEAVTEQLRQGYQYYLAEDGEGGTAGFLAFYRRGEEPYLSKFYLLKERRGKGLARDMLAFVKENAEKCGATSITLNVNKNNSAVAAYEKLGFERVWTEVNDIGGGFVMDDYVYELRI